MPQVPKSQLGFAVSEGLGRGDQEVRGMQPTGRARAAGLVHRVRRHGTVRSGERAAAEVLAAT